MIVQISLDSHFIHAVTKTRLIQFEAAVVYVTKMCSHVLLSIYDSHHYSVYVSRFAF